MMGDNMTAMRGCENITDLAKKVIIFDPILNTKLQKVLCSNQQKEEPLDATPQLALMGQMEIDRR